MSEKSRDDLKVEFKDGERPSGKDFADLIESCLNRKDDGLHLQDGDLVLSQGIVLRDSAQEVAGTLRFDGSTVLFWDGLKWVDLAGGGGAFARAGGAGEVAYAGGNVGIGEFTEAEPPTFKLDVNLGPNTDESQRVRFGYATLSNGSAGRNAAHAYFSHQQHSSDSGYALRQRKDGVTQLNSRQAINLCKNGNEVRMAVSKNGNVIVGDDGELSGAGAAIFQVKGAAFKDNGEENWDITSDARVKEDVRDLEAGLEQLLQVRPVRYRFNGKADTPAGTEGVGIIGQEIEQVFPETIRRVPCVLDGETIDLRTYNGSTLTYVLINAVKELAAKVTRLEAALPGGGPDGDDG